MIQVRFSELKPNDHFNFQKSLIACNDHTFAGKSIAGVSSIAGTVETIWCVGTGGKFAASSVVLSTFIHIRAYASYQTGLTHLL